MTREEIINALQDDKMMPFIQPDQLAKIVDFVSENYKPSLPDGLEEAAEKSASQYYVDGGYSPFQNVETAAHEAGFIAGAKWQKKLDDLETADLLTIAHLQGMEQQKAKMMKDAVEGTVVELGETYKDLAISASAKALNQVLQSLGLEDGDKVRVIIIKEDEK